MVHRFLAGHEVVITPSVAEAQATLATTTFDVVLVDYDLDDGKGDVLVGAIKGMAGPTPKIVAISARSEGNEKMLEAGADAAVSKLRFGEVVGVLREPQRRRLARAPE